MPPFKIVTNDASIHHLIDKIRMTFMELDAMALSRTEADHLAETAVMTAIKAGWVPPAN